MPSSPLRLVHCVVSRVAAQFCDTKSYRPVVACSLPAAGLTPSLNSKPDQDHYFDATLSLAIVTLQKIHLLDNALVPGTSHLCSYFLATVTGGSCCLQVTAQKSICSLTTAAADAKLIASASARVRLKWPRLLDESMADMAGPCACRALLRHLP